MTSSGLEKVAIKAIPERPAVAASESLSEFAVLVGLKAPSLPDDARRCQRAPIDLVTVLDVSGSMYGEKLWLLKTAVYFIIDNLGPSDRLSIVSFSSSAQTALPLSNMTDEGRENARRAVHRLYAEGGTNIVYALKMGVEVLEDRSQPNPVFLSDGCDTCNYSSFSSARSRWDSGEPEYLRLLPFSIFPRNRGVENTGQATFPVHTFGFGMDHDPVVMHAIADASGGTFSFIQSHVMLQDAFACCIGGLLSVVTQDLCLNLMSASHGVEITSIPSGRYANEISMGGSRGVLKIGDLYADEEKEFLINLSVPSLPIDEDTERKTSLLDMTCSYRDMVSNEMVQIQVELVEIRRPKSVSSEDMSVNLEVERQRIRLLTLVTITEAQQMAETGNMAGAQAVLSEGRSRLYGTACAQVADPLCMWLDGEMEETGKRMGTTQEYIQQGRAYALAGISSHAYQRAATRGNNVPGAAAAAPGYAPSALGYGASARGYAPSGLGYDPPGCLPFVPVHASSAPIGYSPSSPGYAPTAPSYGCALPCGNPPSYNPPGYAAYVTPTMANMVAKSQQQSDPKRVSGNW
ncbi:E3 ubiquitin-protein ligase WAV3-like [Henckelia pumila]|uniref:E3 ubiquitin-protein ligase WAV3-like n=1 Tax=Henckelia pumila TaxID=405737 RepID=UPI003C6DC5C2